MRVLNYGFSSDIQCRYEPPELMKHNRLTEHSYAMKNASEDVRCMAGHVTEFDNNHNGAMRTLLDLTSV